MAISTLDGYIAAVKQRLTWYKSGSRTSVAALPTTVFDQAGNPGAGALAIGNTAAGIVPVSTDAGYPLIRTITNTGYLSRVEFSSPVACRLILFDRLFAAGAYAYNADTTLASQPSYAGRVPGANYAGLELWVEAVTAFTLVPAFEINYLDQDGAAGDTGSIAAPNALILGRCFQLPLAAGDNGIQQITRVRCITASAGTFNVMVLRRLWTGRVTIANANDVYDLLWTGMPQVYSTSALYVMVAADSTATSTPECAFEVADG
jgi:hypothetical protein